MKVFAIIFLSIFFSCNQFHKATRDNFCFADNFSQKVEKVSLNDISKIKSLDGVFVQIDGFLTYEFENVALYPYKWAESKSALWLNFSNSMFKSEKQLDSMNRKEIIVIGKINIKRKGHLGYYMAELDSVFCMKYK